MPLERPTLPDLIDRGATELESRLPGVLARARRSLVGVINRVVAGGLSALYRYVEYLIRQIWPDTCDHDFLDGHGARWRVPRNPAVPSTGSVRFTGLNGTVIPAGTQVQRADGLTFATIADGAIAAGEALVAVQANLAGEASNTSIDTSLTLSSPIAGIVANAVAATEISGGADLEAPEAYRARILARIRKPPQGGRQEDYEEWAKEVPGVTRAWVYPSEQGAGTVVVRFMRDDDEAGAIPDAGEVATVQAYIDATRPVTAALFVLAPIADALNFTIALTPDTVAVRAAVAAELADVIRREGKPGGTIPISHLREAISIAAGETDHVLTVPAANVVSPTGHMPTMGVITWV